MGNTQPDEARAAALVDARALIAQARTAALATIDRQSIGPYVSLVAVTALPDCTPVLLLSDLARHTRNLAADRRASLLFCSDLAGAAPLAAARVTVIGFLESTKDPVAREVYLAHHPAAEEYAGFGDFQFYRHTPASAHFIGGFGRIIELAGDDLTGA